jgi:hypothetical protein
MSQQQDEFGSNFSASSSLEAEQFLASRDENEPVVKW